MELIYFILGIMTVLWALASVQSHKITNENKDIQNKLDIMDNYIKETSEEYFKQWENAMESMTRVTIQLESIQEQLNSTDLASALTKLEADIATLDVKFKTESQAIDFAKKSTDHNFNKTFNDIQSLRTALNQLAQDPNLMSRY
jgi:hypothetical protein